MSSRLHNKINSYSIQKGIQFNADNNFPPVETGSLPQSEIWSNTTSGPSTSLDGPGGSAGSIKYNLGTMRRNRLTGSWTSAFTDAIYSMGFWFKVEPSTYVPDEFYNMFIATPPVNGGVAININCASAGNPETTYLLINTYYAITPITINKGEWYYVAVIRNYDTVSVYLNGSLSFTLTGQTPAGSITGVNFGSNAQSYSNVYPATFSMSNFYVADPSVIGATEIAEIWEAGKKVSTPIKSWDGVAWVTDTNITRYEADGVRTPVWHDVNAQRWNGSSWVTL